MSAQVQPLRKHLSLTSKGDKKQALYKLFSAYILTVPLEELIQSVERARRDAQLRSVALYGVLCSNCLSRAERLDRSYLERSRLS
jgi:hypothetical protein